MIFKFCEPGETQFNDLAKSEAPGAMFRVSVESGGCSGFSYKFGWDTQKAEDDLVLTLDGATVLLDPVTGQPLHNADGQGQNRDN